MEDFHLQKIWEAKIVNGLSDKKFNNLLHKQEILYWLSYTLILEKWCGNLDEIFSNDLFAQPFCPPYWHQYSDFISSLLTYPGTNSWLKFLASKPTTWYQWYLVHNPWQNDNIKRQIHDLIIQEHQSFVFYKE